MKADTNTLEFSKLDGILHRDMKDRVGDTEKVQTRALIKAPLLEHDCRIQHTWAIAAVRNSAAILSWIKLQIAKLDRKTCKMFTMRGALCQR